MKLETIKEWYNDIYYNEDDLNGVKKFLEYWNYITYDEESSNNPEFRRHNDIPGEIGDMGADCVLIYCLPTDKNPSVKKPISSAKKIEDEAEVLISSIFYMLKKYPQIDNIISADKKIKKIKK